MLGGGPIEPTVAPVPLVPRSWDGWDNGPVPLSQPLRRGTVGHFRQLSFIFFRYLSTVDLEIPVAASIFRRERIPAS